MSALDNVLSIAPLILVLIAFLLLLFALLYGENKKVFDAVFNWLFFSGVILVFVALIILFFLLGRNLGKTTQPAVTGVRAGH